MGLCIKKFLTEKTVKLNDSYQVLYKVSNSLDTEEFYNCIGFSIPKIYEWNEEVHTYGNMSQKFLIPKTDLVQTLSLDLLEFIEKNDDTNEQFLKIRNYITNGKKHLTYSNMYSITEDRYTGVYSPYFNFSEISIKILDNNLTKYVYEYFFTNLKLIKAEPYEFSYDDESACKWTLTFTFESMEKRLVGRLLSNIEKDMEMREDENQRDDNRGPDINPNLDAAETAAAAAQAGISSGAAAEAAAAAAKSSAEETQEKSETERNQAMLAKTDAIEMNKANAEELGTRLPGADGEAAVNADNNTGGAAAADAAKAALEKKLAEVEAERVNAENTQAMLAKTDVLETNAANSEELGSKVPAAYTNETGNQNEGEANSAYKAALAKVKAAGNAKIAEEKVAEMIEETKSYDERKQTLLDSIVEMQNIAEREQLIYNHQDYVDTTTGKFIDRSWANKKGEEKDKTKGIDCSGFATPILAKIDASIMSYIGKNEDKHRLNTRQIQRYMNDQMASEDGIWEEVEVKEGMTLQKGDIALRASTDGGTSKGQKYDHIMFIDADYENVTSKTRVKTAESTGEGSRATKVQGKYSRKASQIITGTAAGGNYKVYRLKKRDS